VTGDMFVARVSGSATTRETEWRRVTRTMNFHG
jgi:hypothetical protein